MKKSLLLVFICFVFLSLNCAQNITRSEDSSFVFGYIDTKDYRSELIWLSIKQVAPVTENPYYFAAVDSKGMFWFYNMKKGAYRIVKFAAEPGCIERNLLGIDSHQFGFPEYGDNGLLFKLDKPSILFLGSYKVKKIKTGFFEEGKFEIEKTASPTEKEVLGSILVNFEKNPWYLILKDHYNKLN